jgi:DNA-binding LacI/PurR family transcriptional regulator
MVEPGVSTFRQPIADMARSATELVLRRLREEVKGDPSTIVFRTQLVARDSVAQPRKTKAGSAASTR